ncbi:twin-arginine translocase TatA/TatE family subunit [Flavobacterium sp. HSC-61S13]|uniref:Sec-independent protein translocase subunit TatA/TatB n=1 Tax=Flavobacterium sp. HSC-61S13 TaxID=2910963 RepID=UPI00209E69A4|nr:twin-arginine translocase TatA/TatE family subunit [Flavobacterium sp. HSC-61S13]MCP1996138.1 sec-independent protein translocase protein TatA [Flavobacterium sp. HSC-61S13]
MYSSLVFLGAIAPSELILVVAFVLLLFGGKKIPELMKGLGTGIKEFKNATKDTDNPTAKAAAQAQEEQPKAE